jgi:hypothetical protein
MVTQKDVIAVDVVPVISQLVYVDATQDTLVKSVKHKHTANNFYFWMETINKKHLWPHKYYKHLEKCLENLHFKYHYNTIKERATII